MFQDDTTGLRFGSFEVMVRPDGSVYELGRGGFGRTLLARHAALDTEVALKLIDERHALDGAARERFLKEAREQARLAHPGIARITDCGEVDGQLYYAVELCPGGNTREFVLRTGPLSVPDTFHLLAQAAAALDYSHRRGVVHLDIKPSNLMLVFDEDGVPEVKLIDFGLVRSVSADPPSPEAAGRALFSAAFASPEQIRSQPADGRSDLFSLGLTAWFLLTGRNPVEGPADQVIQERLSAGEYEARLPADLTGRPRAVLARLLRKNVVERYASAAELLTDLRACLREMPRITRHWPERRRREGSLADRFMLEKGVPSRHGTVHQAMDREKRRRVKITVLRPPHTAPVIAGYRKAMEAATVLDDGGLLRVLEVTEFTEGWAVVEESPQAASLTEILRGEGAGPLGRYAPLIWQIAAAVDTAFAAGFTGVLLEEAVVELPPESARGGIDWTGATLRVPLFPVSGQDGGHGEEAMEGDFTRTTSTSVAGVQLVARWVYFVIGGKNPPPSSLYSLKEYIPIPGLGAASNQILARHLCGQASPLKCDELLRPLFMADGISWESVGEKIRQVRWGGVLQQTGAFMDDLEENGAAAERISDACQTLSAEVPEAVAPCLEAVSSVRAALASARTQETVLNQSGGRSLTAGKATLAALEESAALASAALTRAETALKGAQAAATGIRQARERREHRRHELVHSLADSWNRTMTAAEEAAETARQCRRDAPSSTAARQMESLAARTGALAAQLEGIYQEALAAPEAEWARLEARMPEARQVAMDAGEMARTCQGLLEKAKVEARRQEEHARLREQLAAELNDVIARAEPAVSTASGISDELRTLAGESPSLEEMADRTATDAARVAGIVADLRALQTVEATDATRLNHVRQKATAALEEMESLMAALHTTQHRARPLAEAHAREKEEQQRRAEEERQRAEEQETARLAAEEAQRLAEAEELRRAEAEAERQRLEEIERLRQEAMEAERRQREEQEAVRLAVEEAQRLAEAEELRRAEAEAERQRLEEIERLRQEAMEAERRQREEQEAARLAAEEAQRLAEAEELRRVEAEAEHQRLMEIERFRQEALEAERRQREEQEAARLAAEEAQRLAEAEELRRVEAEAEHQRLMEIERFRQEALEAERRQREEQEAARLAAEEAQRLAEAEELRRVEAEAEHQRLMEIERFKQEALEAERRQREEQEAARLAAEEARRLAEAEKLRRVETEADHGPESIPFSTPEVPSHSESNYILPEPEPEQSVPPRAVEQAAVRSPRSRKGMAVGMLMVLLLAGGGAGAWLITRDHGTAPAAGPSTEPPAPLPPPVHTVTVRLSGDALTARMVSAGDLKLKGPSPAILSRDGNDIRVRTETLNTPVSLTLESPVRGLAVTPATMEIPLGSDIILPVSIAREKGTVIPAAPAQDNVSHTRAILTWAGEPGFAGPGSSEPFLFELTKQSSLSLPTGRWSVTFDDDEPEAGKPGASGDTVEATSGGFIIVRPGRETPLPPLP